jgi:hypothetical protein
VATAAAKKRIEQWEIKYAAKDCTKVIAGENLSENDIQILMEEKQNNALGLTGKGNKELSTGIKGDTIGREKLKEAIERDNPGIIDLTNIEKPLPMQIRWDYYGEIR